MTYEHMSAEELIAELQRRIDRRPHRDPWSLAKVPLTELDQIIWVIKSLSAQVEQRAAEIARLEAIIAQHGDTDTHWANGQPRLLRPEAYERLRHTVGDTNT